MPSRLFPYNTVRQEQDKLIEGIKNAVQNGGSIVVHAPTGLGKTAAALAPTIEYAIDHNKIVMFLTSRLTQHRLALETVKHISKRHNVSISAVDLIGKKHLCLQEGTENLGGKEFAEYCKSLRENGLCEYYERLKTGEQHSAETRAVLVQLGSEAPNSPEHIKETCAESHLRLCPYEITMLMAKEARVIVTDYSYIFNPRIREGFLRRINRELNDCIIVIDEAHNLPDRVKDLATEQITTRTLQRAIREVDKYASGENRHYLQRISEVLQDMAQHLKDEKYISKEEFLKPMENITDIEILIESLDSIAIAVREEQRSSSCGAIAGFLHAWQGEDEGFTRILSVGGGFSENVEIESPGQQTLHPIFGQRNNTQTTNTEYTKQITLSYRCLDPAVITKPVIESAQSTILMSGTLTPPEMYGQLLGAPESTHLSLLSPFPESHRLNIIIPKTTTKFTTRSPAMYQSIADTCVEVLDAIPGNCAVFFPSYSILHEIKPFVETRTEKTIFTEHPSFTKEEREDVLDRFQKYQKTGAVLLGVMGGSFSEGIDLPGDALRGVIVVGLPLGRPDLETKALIDHYQKKFGKGWEYGYTYPAFNKTLQSAGRCIRTETDKGVIVFIDERYAWPNYRSCFPKEWSIAITLRYVALLKAFFSEVENESK